MSGKIESGEFAAASFASVDNGNLTNPSRTVNAKDCENYARSRSRQRWSAVPVRCAPCRQGSPSSGKDKEGLTLNVSEEGGLSLYGMGRFPVTLYKEQWLRILASAREIEAFIRENDSKLKTKE